MISIVNTTTPQTPVHNEGATCQGAAAAIAVQSAPPESRIAADAGVDEGQLTCVVNTSTISPSAGIVADHTVGQG